MRELSLHVLDIVENSINAGSDTIKIIINESRYKNILTIIIKDNGPGIPQNMIQNITDPFVTSRTTRRVGLGLSLFEAAAKRCKGRFIVKSKQNHGSSVLAAFEYDHIDRAPLGDMSATLFTLMSGYPFIDFKYIHIINGHYFLFDTKEIKKELEIDNIISSDILILLKDMIDEKLRALL